MKELKYDRWLVALDLTEMDKTIVSWVSYLSTALKPKTVYFMHVEEDFELPDYMPKDLNTSVTPTDESQRAQVEQLVSENFKNEHTKVEIEVIEGKPFETLLHWAKVKKIDLFVAGRKHTAPGSGILPHKLSRKLSSSVLFIPEVKVKEVREILVPIDFSEHSSLAVQVGMNLSSKLGGCKVNCHHIYKVPIGFYKTGKSYEEFADLMKVNSTKEFEKFIQPHGNACGYTASLDGGSSAELIHREVESKGVDLVIMGSQGQSAGAFLLLGSTTEKLIQINESSLTLVVKKENENIGFFEALKKL